MPDSSIDPGRDQPVIFANLQRGRPVFSQVTMRFPENPVAAQKDDNAENADPEGDMIVGERQQRREDIKKRNEKTANSHRNETGFVAWSRSVGADRRAVMPFDMRHPDDKVRDPVPE